MKKTEINKQLNEKENKALFKELEDLNKKAVQLRFDNSFRKLKNIKLIKENRKQIARIKTILSVRAQEQIK